jgi:hypothetical protein
MPPMALPLHRRNSKKKKKKKSHKRIKELRPECIAMERKRLRLL